MNRLLPFFTVGLISLSLLVARLQVSYADEHPPQQSPSPSTGAISEMPSGESIQTVADDSLPTVNEPPVPNNPGVTRSLCDSWKVEIQRINQTPVYFRFALLPRRAFLERSHRQCLQQQSYREREFLESLPKR